jgi:hypothetical protein
VKAVELGLSSAMVAGIGGPIDPGISQRRPHSTPEERKKLNAKGNREERTDRWTAQCSRSMPIVPINTFHTLLK